MAMKNAPRLPVKAINAPEGAFAAEPRSAQAESAPAGTTAAKPDEEHHEFLKSKISAALQRAEDRRARPPVLDMALPDPHSAENAPLQAKLYKKSDVQDVLPQPVIRFQTGVVAGIPVAHRVEATGLHLATGSTGTSTPANADANQHSAMFNTVRGLGAFQKYAPGGVNLYEHYGGQKTHDAHLLSEKIHGKAVPQNLTLVPKAVNMALRGIEWYTAGRMVQDGGVEVFDWEAYVNYGRSNMPTDFENAFPTQVEVRATPQAKTDEDAWVDDPAAPPFFRAVSVTIPPRGQARAQPNAQAGARNSPFDANTLLDRTKRQLFISDSFVKTKLADFYKNLLDQDPTADITHEKPFNPDFKWSRPRVEAFVAFAFSDQFLADRIQELLNIAKTQLLAAELEDKLYQARLTAVNQLTQDADFQYAAMRKHVVDYFFSNFGNQAYGDFPKEALDQIDFWPQQHLEGLTEMWFLQDNPDIDTEPMEEVD